jgi:hypothetical protein
MPEIDGNAESSVVIVFQRFDISLTYGNGQALAVTQANFRRARPQFRCLRQRKLGSLLQAELL